MNGHTKGHNWMMILCIIPMVLFAAFLAGKGSFLQDGASGYAWLGLLLLCPLGHLLMMRGMHHHGSERQPEAPAAETRESGGKIE